MTDRIDLDELDLDESPDEDEPKRGDWFWKGEGDPDTEPDESVSASTTVDDGEATDGTEDARTPHVPRENEGRPVGIPIEQGGAGTAESNGEGEAGEAPDAAGPHGGGVDDMTMAITYDAAKRLVDPGFAITDAGAWADWVGIVGNVDAFVINKFQREHAIDADFFNGTGTGPGERLAEIDEHSMFFAERMVVVGVAGTDEPIAERADWEFVPLTEAAEKAGWDLSA